ncbi:MAG TPA: RpiB/LacA/LacB family sugar-phosphate isomerase [Patescibacteria group bacterium]|jgi:ribose 5-phosphate isomerase B|nr:RpiB/LacA/LacB family sugar-phosphate isomerase [Patescibacteria group bacterium]
MKIFLATDHAGFKLKEEIKQYLQEQKYEVVDCGAFSIDPADDYPNFIAKAAEEIENDPNSFGIVFGRSGAGEEIVANKFKNVRAVLGFSKENVQLSRQHNNANVLSLGTEFEDFTKAKELVDIFLKTPFSNDPRHIRRVSEIKEIEDKNYA